MTDRTYSHTYAYRGFTIAAYTDNGKAVGSFGDMPVYARYYILDEFEQNVMPLDMWFWSPVDAFAGVDAICNANPTLDPKKWAGVYARLAEHRRLLRFMPFAIDALDTLRRESEDWTFNSGEECTAAVNTALAPLFRELQRVGPVPPEMF